MSYNVDIVVPAVPPDDPGAWALSAALRERYFDDERPIHPLLITLHNALTARYRCLSSYGPDEDMDACAWSDGPLIGNFSGEMCALGIARGPLHQEVLDFLIASAQGLGLTVFDPQRGAVHRPAPDGSYTVAVHGVLEGFSADAVLARLAGLVKADLQQLRVLLGTPGTVVKRGLDRSMAEKYRSALLQIGCDCRVSPPLVEAASALQDRWQTLLAEAEAGDPDAQFWLGLAYRKKTDVANRDELSAQWFTRAAEQNHVEAATALANCYRSGSGVPKDYAAALHWAQKAAGAGNAVAQFLLWRMLRDGEGVRPNKPEGAQWLMRAAEQGLADAQCSIGQALVEERNFTSAAMWLSKAMEQGNVQAQACIADLYLQGEGVACDRVLGTQLMAQAAEQGLASAQHRFAQALATGIDVLAAPKQALKWYQKAADQGYAPSMHQLGMCYRNGAGVPRDVDRGIALILSAAEHGYAESQFVLGGIYLDGEGRVAADAVASERWLRKAAALGHTDAIRIAKLMGR